MSTPPLFPSPAYADQHLNMLDNTRKVSTFAASFQSLILWSHSISVFRGWWQDKKTRAMIERDEGTMIALQHSELSEMLEGVRTGAKSEKLPGFSNEEEEAADLLHRLFDYAAARQLRLGEAYVAKGLYNLKRQDHSLEARNAEGGKAF